MAITLQNSGVFVETVGGTTHTLGTTLSAGVKRKVILMTGNDATNNVTSATFNGQAMTAVAGATIQNTTDVNIDATTFYYDVPDALGAGSYNIVVTSGTMADVTLYYWQLSNAATGAPEDADETEWTTTSTNATLTLSCSDGAALLGLAVTSSASQTWTITGTASERTESNETNYTTVVGDAIAMSGAGNKTITATVSTGSTGNKCLVAVSIAAVSGPTINTQPSAATALLVPATDATFTVEATTSGGTLTYQWQKEDSVGAGTYSNISNSSVYAGVTTATLTITITGTTLDGLKYRCNVTDDNGTTATNGAVLSAYTGHIIVQPSATDAAGDAAGGSVATDYTTPTDSLNRVIATCRGVVIGVAHFVGVAP